MLQRIIQGVAGVLAAIVIVLMSVLVVREQWKPAAEAEATLAAVQTKKPVIANTPPAKPGAAPKAPKPTEAVRPQSTTPQTSVQSQPELEPEDPNGTPSPARRLPNRTFTWAEVEETLEKLRQERPSRPEAIDDLESWYAYLASPIYTKSPDLPEHAAKLAEWRRTFPQSQNLLVVLGRVHIAWAWEARGSGWASTVTEEGWQQFHTRIGEARRLLQRAIEMGVKDGEAYAALITVAMADSQPVEETRTVLDAGMKVDPTYYRMYEAMATYLLPRWHGEPGDIEKLALEIRQRIGGDDGLDAYGHIAYATNQYDGVESASVFRNFDQKLLVQAAEVLIRRYPHARNLPCFAALCTIAAQDHAAARRIRASVKYTDSPRVPAWRYLAKEFQQWCDSEPPQGEADWIWGTTLQFGNLAFATDSRYIWCGNGYGPPAVQLLDLETKQVSQVLTAPASALHDFEWDASKQWVLATLDTKDRFRGWVLWDLADGRTWPHPTAEGCVAIAIHPQRPLLAWALSKTIHSIDMSTAEEGPTIEFGQYVHRLRFSGAGEKLAIQGEAISVWDVTTGKLVCRLPSPRDEPQPALWCDELVDFDEQGRVWAMAREKSIPGAALLVRFSPDGTSHESVITFRGQQILNSPKALSPGRRWLAMVERGLGTRESEPICLWDLASDKEVRRLGGHWDHIGKMAFSPDGKKLASISLNGGPIKVWSLEDLVAP